MADALEAAIAKLGEEPKEVKAPEAEPEEAGGAGRRVMLPAVVPAGTGGSEVPLPAMAAELDAVEKLNFKHAVIANYGGKCLVLSWDPWSINKRVLVPTFQAFDTFKHRYCHKSVAVGHGRNTKQIPAGEFWLNHPKRRNYEGVECEPGGPEVLPGNVLNLWRGFAVVPRKGNWRLLLAHIKRVLAAGDPKAAEYILRWIA